LRILGSPWSKRTAALATTVALALGGGAFGAAPRAWDTEASAFFSYDFGSGGHFGFGIELRRMYGPRWRVCDQGAGATTGGAARIAFYGTDWEPDQLRVLVAPQLGVATSAGFPFPVESFGGELGLGYRLGRGRGLFLQPGLELAVHNALFLRLDHSLGFDRESGRFEHAGVLDLGARAAAGWTQGCGVE
jgi:hypothetical protein